MLYKGNNLRHITVDKINTFSAPTGDQQFFVHCFEYSSSTSLMCEMMKCVHASRTVKMNELVKLQL